MPSTLHGVHWPQSSHVVLVWSSPSQRKETQNGPADMVKHPIRLRTHQDGFRTLANLQPRKMFSQLSQHLVERPQTAIVEMRPRRAAAPPCQFPWPCGRRKMSRLSLVRDLRGVPQEVWERVVQEIVFPTQSMQNPVRVCLIFVS